MSTWRERADEVNRLIKAGKTNRQIAEHYGVSLKTVKNRVGELRAQGLVDPYEPAGQTPEPGPELQLNYKETTEILADGSHKSDKLLRMTAEQSKDVDYLLQAHGYDKAAWELVSARSNIWNSYSKQDGIMTLYASKITVKPRLSTWTFDDLVQAIHEVVPVTDIQRPITHDGYMLEIPFYDSHFGISGYADYQHTQADTMNLIESRKWEQILFTIGQDLFHNDNFRGTTANGTPIQQVDMPKAWRDARQFYEPLIVAAMKQSPTVKLVYSKGNHDESIAWTFVQWLTAKFPDAICDDRFIERKVHVFHRCFIGITHGEKTPAKELVSLFTAEFPIEFSQTVTREIHKGHFHKEDSTDGYGMMVRTLATRNKTDQWHDDKGFKGAHKRFQLFEWSTDALESIHYV